MITDFSKLTDGQKVYFASDFHLGAPTEAESLTREKLIIQWLNEIKDDAEAIFFVGDTFDFWFEYKHSIPKGNIRFLGKLAELSDSGIKLIFYSGNHDLWMDTYLQEQLNVRIYHEPQKFNINGKSFYIAHGDGLGPGDLFYKFVKKIFLNPVCRWAFRWIHPDLGVALAKYWSDSSRDIEFGQKFTLNEEKEALLIYSRNIQKECHHDYYIFGHRHLPLDISLENNARYINLGEWFTQMHFGEFDGENFTLKRFEARNE